jgi:N-acetylmuramoyl-L-alanine amidase
MNRTKVLFLFLCASLILLFISSRDNKFSDSFSSLLGSVFFTPSITTAELTETYTRAAQQAARKVKILIIPGHDDASPGTAFNGLKEKDINLATAKELATIFGDDPLFAVTLARDENGYNESLVPKLLSTDEIKNFSQTHKETMNALIAGGKIERTSGVFHNDALPETALRLYALNKWANENDFDLIINIHFNDYPGHRSNTTGKYNGFSIYVPEKQYSNAGPSIEIGNYIKIALEKLFPVSNHPQEHVGVIEDQELIAIGSFNTLDAAVVLIEYDYIYAPALQNESVRALAIKKYAHETYNGVKNYFEVNKNLSKTIEKKSISQRYAVLAHEFTNELERGITDSTDVFLLQLALARAGSYPPKPYTLNDCPPSGKFGECTEEGVMDFQKKNNLPITGVVGEKTRSVLNTLGKNL